jgi:subtilisin family serine protease
MNKSFSFKILILSFFITTAPLWIAAQTNYKANWQNLDLKSDTVFGISTERAYKELLQNKKSVPVVVAVIDSGVDINHEDLKGVIYQNPKEKVNGIDDDKNGYTDDIDGWNFLGGKNGNVEFETLEMVRLIRALRPKYEKIALDSLSKEEETNYIEYLNMKSSLNKQYEEAMNNFNGIYGFKKVLEGMLKKLERETPDLSDFENFTPLGEGEAQIKEVMINVLKDGMSFKDFKKNEIDQAFNYYEEKVKYQLNIDFNPRDIVGDDEKNDDEKIYGNKDVIGADATHGTHVSGIIAALRNNTIGIKGVANNVLILPVRAVPNGDERDKDVANAIRYAADNGAKIINMSFGKGYSQNKKVVDDAVKYAIAKDVLLIHAAGNENADLDESENYPTKNYENKSGLATAWIEVGASGPLNDSTLKASFSNYGKTVVDVFAPGVQINSTTPLSTYSEQDGTSMAAPVVSGLAALIRSYYPNLTALQVKEIILKSVVKVNTMVNVTVKGELRKIPFSDLSITGGVINTYNALKLAETYSKSKAALN